MVSPDHKAGLYPALLKHWRGKRGLSQLDLALAADVSARHVSFLETGRSAPSAEMVVRLATSLDVPLRHVNAMMQAAGFEAVYPDPELGSEFPEEVAGALRLMKEHHDPFPLIVINRRYDVIDLNRGALSMFSAVSPQLAQQAQSGLNLARISFDPNGAHDAIVNFDEVGRAFLWRLQREVLAEPDDGPLRALLEELLELPTVPPDWRRVDLSVPSLPTVTVRIRAGDGELRFVTMVTAFQAPQTVMLDELRIETWFPTDPATAEACRSLAGS